MTPEIDPQMLPPKPVNLGLPLKAMWIGLFLYLSGLAVRILSSNGSQSDLPALCLAVIFLALIQIYTLTQHHRQQAELMDRLQKLEDRLSPVTDRNP